MRDDGSSLSRRKFVKLVSSAAALAVGISDLGSAAVETQPDTAPGADAYERELALAALDAARSAGALYADVRIVRALSESIGTRERQITNVGKGESFGIGVRAFVGGRRARPGRCCGPAR